MLYLIGTGLLPNQLTFEALKAGQHCDELYLEYYTSRFSDSTVNELEKKFNVKKKIAVLNRSEVENKISDIVFRARKKNIGLLVIGNPLFATTHIEFLLQAKKQNVKIKVVPGISVPDLVSLSGLDAYKFGRIATVVFPQKNFAPESFFDFITANHQTGLHSLCLLDIQSETEKMMATPQAVEILEAIAKKRNADWFFKTPLIALCGLGNKNQKIAVENSGELKKKKFELFPQSLIVCGALNDKETEALQTLYGYKVQSKQNPKSPLHGNPAGLELEQKLSYYHQLTEKALKTVRIQKNLSEKEHQTALDFLEVAQRYLDDGQYFWQKSEYLTALAAFSYAHAWLDAGVRSGVLDGQNNDHLFVLPP